MIEAFNLNNFFNTIELKKKYLKKLKKKVLLLKSDQEKIYKRKNELNSFLIVYIVSIFFSKSNTLMHIADFSGKLKFFYSSGNFNYSGKSKKARSLIFKNFYRLIVNKLKFLRNKPIALHLANVGSNKSWIIKKFKKRFFIRVIKSFNFYPHNGCRKKKVIRKKFKRKVNEEMAEWFKAADCKSVEFIIVGSNPTFFKYYGI